MMLIGGHDFFSNGDAAVCTMMGDVWIVSGLDEKLEKVTWKRFATGLNQALGLWIDQDEVYVVGRDRITHLEDVNKDGTADFYNNFCGTYHASSGGHDFTVGLQRDDNGYFYFAATGDVVRVAPDGSSSEVIANGLRNPNGIGVSGSGIVTTSTNQGDWTPASMVFEVQEGDFYGRRAKKDGQPIAPAMCYIPRGLDNSSGGQIFVESDSWGKLNDQLLHFSFGYGSWMMILRDVEEGKRTQGAVVPFKGDFESGAHRARFNPKDGHLYVTGADGWGNYAITDGSFDRIRYVGSKKAKPIAWKAHRNGILVKFDKALDAASIDPKSFFAQIWNYEYAESYGSMEYSLKQPAMAGHDRVPVQSVHLLEDGRSLFVEMPEVQTAMQMHVFGRLKTSEGADFNLDLYPTLLRLAPDYKEFAGYQPSPDKPTEISLRVRWPVPFKPKHPNTGPKGRSLTIEAISGLQYDAKELRGKAGERVTLHFKNTDSIPHNWVLVKNGAFERVGQASNLMMADPKVADKHYIPESEDVLHYTPMLYHNQRYQLSFNLPNEPGVYPYMCTFPGHWMVMKGNLVVE